jgi:hypothetical protein
MPTLVQTHPHPTPIFGVPDQLHPVHNLPAGARAQIFYNNNEFARAEVTIGSRVEGWILGVDEKGRTVLAFQQWERRKDARFAALMDAWTRALSALEIALFPLLFILDLLVYDYQRNRKMLDDYCSK